ncbi:MAG: cobalamin-binding protein [Chloroflexi bacterium]|nr:cobalamin-binding protein [Chloroflexota bacterium]
MRICSFLPSGTEIVFALGLGDSLGAVSHECDYPAAALDKPKIVRSKFDANALSSQEIDRIVTEMYRRGERIYEVDEDVLRDAAPDLVITQELCDVCAVSYEDVRHAASRLPYPPNVISLDPASLPDMLDDIRMVGDLCGVPDAAAAFVAELRGRMDAVQSRASAAEDTPRVACIEWLDPPIVAGHWIPQMVELAGGVDALAKPGAPSRRITMEELAESQPDVLALMPCGMDAARAREEFERLGNLDEWRKLPAVANGRAYFVDSGSYFSRSGPRLVDGLEQIAEMLRPGEFPSAAAEIVRADY